MKREEEAARKVPEDELDEEMMKQYATMDLVGEGEEDAKAEEEKKFEEFEKKKAEAEDALDAEEGEAGYGEGNEDHEHGESEMSEAPEAIIIKEPKKSGLMAALNSALA